jgi:hypothetical protein
MMKTLVLAVLPLIANAADVTGEWNLRLIRFGEQFASARVNLKAEGTNGASSMGVFRVTIWRAL